MIQSRFRSGIVLLGFNASDIRRITGGEAARFDLGELGLPPQEIAILYGETDQAIKDMLNAGISSKTRIADLTAAQDELMSRIKMADMYAMDTGAFPLELSEKVTYHLKEAARAVMEFAEKQNNKNTKP